MYKLLIVSKSKEVADSIKYTVDWEKINFQLIGSVRNELDALTFLSFESIDVILYELDPYIETNFKIIKHIETYNLSCKVILFNAPQNFDYIKKALQVGVKGYLTAPINMHELQETLVRMSERTNYLENNSLVIDAFSNQSTSNTTIDKVIYYLQLHYQHASLRTAADVAHMHPHYFSTYFKNQTGMMFSEYLKTLKMKKASEFLLNNRYKTYEVSEFVGYSNPKNFSRTFRNFYGVSPREFKKLYI